MKAAASESFGYNEDPIVSSDVIGMRFGSLFDSTQTMVSKIADDLYEVQVVSWYDNENSYTSQMVRTIKYFGKLLEALIHFKVMDYFGGQAVSRRTVMKMTHNGSGLIVGPDSVLL